MRTRWREPETWRGETIVCVRERVMGGSVNGDRAEGNARFARRQGRCLMLAVGIPKERVRGWP